MVPLSMDSSFERLIGGKKRKRKDEEQPTFSFDINLVPYSEDVSAEYSWKQLVERCQRQNDTHLEVNTPLKPKVIIKSQLTPTPKKKKKRRKLDAELEYDIDDPFIDDGELTDEEIPDEMQTAKGGFYINTGNLMLIKRPIKIFDEDTEEMMDKLDKMDENGSETEPEENYQKEIGTIEKEDEVTMSSIPEKKPAPSPPKVSVKKVFVKVKKVKSLEKKMKKKDGPPVSSTPVVKKKKKTEAKKEVTVSVSPVKKVTTPKKASTPQKMKTPKKEGSTPKKKVDPKKTVLKRKKILPSQLPDTSAYDEKVASLVEKIEDSWKCKICQYESETKTGATSHAEQHLEGITLQCVLCEKTFKMKKNLKQHVLKDHIVAEKLTKQRKKILPSQLPDTTAYDEKVAGFLVKSESGWKCNVCNYEHEAKTNVSNHAEQHIENVTLNCKLCEKSFPMKRNLKQHVLKYHAITETIEVKVKSKPAKKTSSPKKKLAKVVKKVGKDVKPKISKKISEPKKEVAVKKKIKANQMCDTTAYDAKVAELLEKVDDKWKCKGCEVSNDAKAFVVKHAEQHVEGFNLPCLLCDKTFSMKRNLRQHIYTKHKEDMVDTSAKEGKTTKSPKKKVSNPEPKPKKGKENCEAKKAQPQANKPVKEKKEKKLLQANSNVIDKVEKPVITLS